MSRHAFWDVALADPDRIALIVDGGGQTSYGELAVLANRLSNGLRALGGTAGSTVAALLTNRAENLALQLATQQVGLVLVPVNRHLTGPEAGYILNDSGAEVLVADSVVGDTAVEAAEIAGIPPTACYAVGELPGFRSFTELLGSPDAPPDRVSGALLLYSSGTTGSPKGISRPRSGLAPEVESDRIAARSTAMGLAPGGVFLGVAPLYHAAPNRHTMGALDLGKTVVLESGFDPERILDLIGKYQVTDTFLVPTMMHRLASLPAATRAGYDVSSMRLVLHAGAMCPMRTKRAMIEWFGPILVEYYGASESGMVTLIDSEAWLRHPGSVGRVRPGADIRVRDDAGNPVPPGTPGSLHLASDASFEYHGDPDKTARSHQDGYFIPGDVGYFDEDGWLFLCDRRTDMIISGGVNIYPAEIETVLLDHDAVLDAAVLGVADPEWGQRVVALLSLHDGMGDNETIQESIMAWCRARLAKFKIPRTLEIVPDLPRTPTGKMNRAKVRDEYLGATRAESSADDRHPTGT